MCSFNYCRRHSSRVNIGNTPVGSEFPIRVQSMTSTSTLDTEGSILQAMRICDAGGEYVRLTAQGVREAENIGVIRTQLRDKGYNVPLIADIHFNPRAAFAAVGRTEKVRINPGNFVDAARTFKKLSYTDEEYKQEITKIRDTLVPFISVCREHGTAIRLGVNHGSLSDRIMSRYGDTPSGMVESVMEFLRICVDEKFTDVVISIKASNTVVMVETVRRLIKAMDAENMHYPLHLGVTEAGDGEDGRIKSAVGIGTLLAEGVGDTIRVSLSEDPEVEIPVARKLVSYITSREYHAHINGTYYDGYNNIQPERRNTRQIDIIGGDKMPIIISSCLPSDLNGSLRPDFYFSVDGIIENSVDRFIVPIDQYNRENNASPLFTTLQLDEIRECDAAMKWLMVDTSEILSDNILFEILKGDDSIILLITTSHKNITGSMQAFLHTLIDAEISTPAVIYNSYQDHDSEWLQVKSGVDFGTLLMNGFRDGIWLNAPKYEGAIDDIVRYSYGVLQATRLRISKTEFISCPGCGRTLFNLQATVKQIKEATSHLTHLKIGIMGCIVNGPGEMADADYGYVGAATGKISLYKGKRCIEMNIPEEEALSRLITLIKDNGDWCYPQ